LSRVDHTTPAPTRACLNCGTLLNGPFCAECGQRDIPPYPSARELVVDAVSELSGWDGRIATSVRTLLLRPGKLTREFLEGRRARYISPLRLYLMASLAYFVLAATAPDVRLDSGKTLFLGLRVSTTVANDSAASRPERVGAAARSAMESQQALSAEARAAVLEEIASAPPLMQPFLRKSVDDPAGFRAGIFAAVPRMMFVLLPVFAGILALFYRGRKYPEHLYFAIHLHAFFFLVFAIVELLKFTQVAPLVIVGAALSTLSLPVYATVAFRHTYGGSLARTVAKEVGIGAIYAVVAATAFIVTIYVVSVAG
jgi:hypothetical protein